MKHSQIKHRNTPAGTASGGAQWVDAHTLSQSVMKAHARNRGQIKISTQDGVFKLIGWMANGSAIIAGGAATAKYPHGATINVTQRKITHAWCEVHE
jgi:hypothetical protein